MKKKLLSLLFAIVTSIGVALADDSGTCGDHLQWYYNSTTHELVITGSENMKNWFQDHNIPWYSYRVEITSVSLPNGLTNIGDKAFYGCTGLNSITIPESVTSIGETAFCGCTSLTNVTIPNSVTSIGYNAFSYVANIVFNGIANGAPWGARSVNGYVDGYLVYSDASKTQLLACSSAATGSITIPESVTNIGSKAFYGCTRLTSITIPNSVTDIGSMAFYGCTGLTSVTIPNSVTSIGNYAFSNVSNVVYNGTATGSTWGARSVNGYVDGYLVYSDASKTQLLVCFPAATGSIVIPNSVTSIGERAFQGCSGLTTVNISNNVTSIGYGAFSGCTGLTSITIPNSVTSIGESAFYGCTNITSIIWNAISYTSSIIFSEITSQITSFVFGENVQTIPASLCSGMSNLTSITIPENVTSIGSNAFRDCTGLKNIFWNAVNYTSYDPFSGITKSNISSFKFGENVQTIPSSLCSEMSNLTSISIPNSVTSIGSGAFYGCSDLTNMIIPNSVTIIGSQAFYGCTGLTSITIPNSVTNIGSAAFSGCTGLTSVTIPNSVTSIEEETFSGCSGLTSVSIGENVRTIGNNTFKDCIGLENLYCYRTLPPNAYSTAFDGVDKFACVLHVPSESIDYYKNAAAWRDFFYVTILGAETAEVTALTITPHEDNADVMWPAVVNAYSYEFTITDSNGNTVCTLTFNANGQLTGLILHAPAADGVMQRAAAGTGFSFNVTGLENGSSYNLVIKAKDSNGTVLQTFSQDFTTGATALENVNADGASGIRKVIEDGKVVIVMPDGRKFDASGRKLR